MPVESNMAKGYHAALDLAISRFAESNAEELAKRSKCEYLSDISVLRFEYLGDIYEIDWPSGDIKKAGSEDAVPITTGVLLVNYILSAHRQLPTDELIAFRDIPGAAIYEPSFDKRSINPLVKTFGEEPDLLLKAGRELDGEQVNVGDVGIRIPVLPLLPIIYAIWHGDDEFPPSGVILFDASARHLLSAECLIVAASNGVYRLIHKAHEIKRQ